MTPATVNLRFRPGQRGDWPQRHRWPRPV